MTKRTKMRGRVECVNECGADESFVWSEIFELTVDEGKKLFFEWRFPQTGIIADRRDRVIDFFFEERKSDILLGSEVIENSALRDAGSTRNGFGSRGIEAFGLEEVEGRLYDAFANRLLVLRAFSGETFFRAARARRRFRGWAGFGRHLINP